LAIYLIADRIDAVVIERIDLRWSSIVVFRLSIILTFTLLYCHFYGRPEGAFAQPAQTQGLYSYPNFNLQ
jgi:hypothetical protein